MYGGQAQSSASIGRHSELIAQTALTANGWTVLIPDGVEPFDIAVTRKGDSTLKRIQVKTITRRFRYDTWWLVIKAKKNNGEVYGLDECDYFIGVTDGCAYMTPNRLISEYYIREDEVESKWTRLYTTIDSYDNEAPKL